MNPRIRVLFIVRQLGRGGAERQLLELLKAMDKRLFDVHLACLYPGGALWQEACSIQDISLTHLGKSGRWHISPLLNLARYLRRVRPLVVHGYTTVPNLLSLIGKLFGGRAVWGVRSSYMDLSKYDYLSRILYRLEVHLSRFADLVICNSQAGRALLEARGFSSNRTIVIENGIDTARFRYDLTARLRIRAEWGVQPQDVLVGLVARFDPMKGHSVFLRAAGVVASRHANARFVLVGDGPPSQRDALRELAASLSLADRLIWAGERADIPAVLSALDLAVSASLGEGFSNTVGECMACGVPCIATDVGDSARIIGQHGMLVPPGNVSALAEGICRGIESSSGDVVARNVMRCHIQREFSTERLAERTSAALCALISSPGKRGANA